MAFSWPEDDTGRMTLCRRTLLVGLIALVPFSAAAESCRIPGHDRMPEIRINAGMAEPVYSRAMNKRELTARHGLLKTGQVELGLTTSEVRLELRPKVWFLPRPDGGGCLALESVELTFRVERVHVDIANDFGTDSCAYQVVRAHEDQHVALTRQAFNAALPEMRRLLVAVVSERRSTVVRSGSSSAAIRDLQNELMARIQPAFLGYQREAHRLNASIDTPQSYAALHNRCRVW